MMGESVRDRCNIPRKKDKTKESSAVGHRDSNNLSALGARMKRKKKGNDSGEESGL